MLDNKRRSFFKTLIGDSLSVLGGTEDRMLSSADVGKLSDDALFDVVPVFSSSCPWKVENGRLLTQREDGRFEQFRRLSEIDKRILVRFDGNHTVSTISNLLEQECRMEWDQAYSSVKDLFLLLAEAGICRAAAHRR